MAPKNYDVNDDAKKSLFDQFMPGEPNRTCNNLPKSVNLLLHMVKVIVIATSFRYCEDKNVALYCQRYHNI